MSFDLIDNGFWDSRSRTVSLSLFVFVVAVSVFGKTLSADFANFVLLLKIFEVEELSVVVLAFMGVVFVSVPSLLPFRVA